METRTIDIEQAPSDIAELFSEVLKGIEVVVTRGKEPVARIIPVPRARRRGGFGSLRGQVWMAEDFAAPLTDQFEDGIA